MNSIYNGQNVRNSLIAAICTILFSSTCLIAAVGPAHAEAPIAHPMQIVVPLA